MSYDGLLIALLLISNVNCFYTCMCTHARARTHISKHQKERRMQTLLFLAFKGEGEGNRKELKATHMK